MFETKFIGEFGWFTVWFNLIGNDGAVFRYSDFICCTYKQPTSFGDKYENNQTNKTYD